MVQIVVNLGEVWFQIFFLSCLTYWSTRPRRFKTQKSQVFCDGWSYGTGPGSHGSSIFRSRHWWCGSPSLNFESKSQFVDFDTKLSIFRVHSARTSQLIWRENWRSATQNRCCGAREEKRVSSSPRAFLIIGVLQRISRQRRSNRKSEHEPQAANQSDHKRYTYEKV